MNTNRKKIPALVKRLYAIVAELESLFPGRKFTPDGHLVGSIGEVIAAHEYGLTLLNSSAEIHDARQGKRLIQIKATQVKYIGLGSEPQYLLVLKLLKDGTTEEIYNGPGAPVWRNAGPMQKNGHRLIRLPKLCTLMKSVKETQKIKKA